MSVIYEVSISALNPFLPCTPVAYRVMQKETDPTHSHSSKWFWSKVRNFFGPLAPHLQPLQEQQIHHSSTLTALPTPLQPGHYPISTRYFGKKGDSIEHTPIAPVQLGRSWGHFPHSYVWEVSCCPSVCHLPVAFYRMVQADLLVTAM